MLSYLAGDIIAKDDSWIVLNVHDVGYKVFCDAGKIANDSKTTLFTHHYIREDQQSLYGFITQDELHLFELLIKVNGVGPKAAMSIMLSATPEKIISAISQGDVMLFKAVSGIGPKAAAKIIVELKNKVGGLGDYDLSTITGGDDVADALESLGYKKAEILSVIKNMPTNLQDIQSKVTWTLKELGKSK